MSSTRTRKALLAVIMALVMSLAMASTAFAAWGQGQIRIDTSGNNDEHKYTAYQILDGDAIVDFDTNKRIMSNVVWGSGISAPSSVLDEFKYYYPDVFRNATDAESMADCIGELNEKYAAEILPGILSRHVDNARGIPLSDKDGEVLYADVDPGYYLILDEGEGYEHDTATLGILCVVAENDYPDPIKPKSSAVEHEKEVVEDSNDETYQKYADYDIGQNIDFRLTGTLPDRISDYKEYTMTFTDTMDEGLTFGGPESVTVWLDKGARSAEIRDEKTGYAKNITDDAKIRWQINDDESTTFTVSLDTRLSSVFTMDELDADTVIYVLYTAKLNEKAEVGNLGNLNKSYLTYSSNPNWNGEGEPETGDTPEDIVTVFTWELDVLKIDELEQRLWGAEFVLYRQVGDNYWDVEYCHLNDGWSGKAKVQSWEKYPSASYAADYADCVLVSDANGKFSVVGLDSGEYFLQEVRAPSGYNLLRDPVRIKISDTVRGNGGTDSYEREKADHEVTELMVEVEGSFIVDSMPGNPAEGTVEVRIMNKRGTELPSTGGMGTMIFTGVGILVMAGAIVAIVIRRRKSSDIA